MGKQVRITHRSTGCVLAEGPLGWGVTPFEGNYYIQQRYLRAGSFRSRGFPGLCIYKFLYVWLDWHPPDSAERIASLGWRYIVPNPLLPFTWWRVALPGQHPELQVERFSVAASLPVNAASPTRSG